MKQTSICLALFAAISIGISAQQYTQTIRGTIVDQDTRQPVEGVNIVLISVDPQQGTISDKQGNFRLDNIAVGRHEIQFSSVGYKPRSTNSFILSSAHETVLNIEMEEMIYLGEEVVIKSSHQKDKSINSMANVSARSFTIEETERYAGTWGDPSRMASNYAGVMSSSEARNDIVIRGNSPLGLLWRLEGNNIPNPNHFAAFGTTGGPISMLNNNLLRNSDFFTGAFPAEYGNALSGAFDLYMRPGNNEKREYVLQAGMNGFELGAEGPLNKAHTSSYLVNYRYSFLGLMEKFGISYGPEGTTPEYQDLSYKLDFAGGKAGKFTFFGIAGNSNVNTYDSKKDTISEYTFDDYGIDFYYKAGMMTHGVNHVYTFSEKTRLLTRFSVSGSFSHYRNDSVSIEDSSITLSSRIRLQEWQYSGGTILKTKLNPKNFFNTGIGIDIYQPSFRDSFMYMPNVYIYNSKADGTMALFQAFAEWNHKFTDQLNLYTGVHGQFLELNNSYSIEPRAGIKWNFIPKQSVSLGYGLHSQTQPHEVYLAEAYDNYTSTYQENINDELDFTKSHHIVLGYNYLVTRDFRVKFEMYYQYIFNVPVEQRSTSYSMLNYGAAYYIPIADSLVNEGTGENKGIELTIEKFFSKNYYFLITTSLFDAKYKGSDGVLRNSAFNNGYVINALAGYEFPINYKLTLAVSEKFVTSGGLRYTPFTAKEISQGIYTTDFDETKAYESQYKPYLRLDLQFTLRMNGKKTTNEWTFDLQNITNRENPYYSYIDRNTGKETSTPLQKFAFMMMWRMRF